MTRPMPALAACRQCCGAAATLLCLWTALLVAQAEEAPAKKPARPKESLNIVVAKNTLIWDGEVVTWDDAVAELRRQRKETGKPIHPHFYFTRGAHEVGRWDEYKQKAFAVYKELFEPAGMSLGSVNPRASERYDAVETAKDLIADPRLIRRGVVLRQGKPVAGALVVVLPDVSVMPIMLRPDMTLRDPLDEVWTTTDEEGKFALPVPDKGHRVAALAKEGFALVSLPEKPPARLELPLEPLATLEVTPLGMEQQELTLRYRPAGLPETSDGFATFEIPLDRKSVKLVAPAGKVTVSRSFKLKDGGSRSYPAETLQLAPGSRKALHLPAIDERDAAEDAAK